MSAAVSTDSPAFKGAARSGKSFAAVSAPRLHQSRAATLACPLGSDNCKKESWLVAWRSLGHAGGEDEEREEGGGAERQEGGVVAQMVDDLAGEQAAHRGADPLHGGDGALRQVEAAGAAHQIGDDQRHQRTVDAGADAVEQLDA